MKTLISFLALSALFASAPALAKTITCQPDPHEAQFMVSATDKEVIVKVINPMGYSYMPQMDTVNESSIPFLKMQSDDLRGLGDSFEYHWAKESCSVDPTNEWFVTCNGSVKAVDTANKIPALGFTTAKSDEKSLRTDQATYKVRLTFENNNIYFVTIPAAQSFCVLTENEAAPALVAAKAETKASETPKVAETVSAPVAASGTVSEAVPVKASDSRAVKVVVPGDAKVRVPAAAADAEVIEKPLDSSQSAQLVTPGIIVPAVQ